MDWTPCSEQCGGLGQQIRPVKVIVAAAHGGRECPLEQDRICNTIPCPTASPTPAPTPCAFITITFKFPGITQVVWDDVQALFLGVLGNVIEVDPILFGVKTEEIQNSAENDVQVADSLPEETSEIQVADSLPEDSGATNGFKVWVTFSTATLERADKILALSRTSDWLSGFLAALRVASFHYECIDGHAAITALCPTTSPTTAPTQLPTISPTYKNFPVVTVIGGNIVTVEASVVGQEYKDQGALCTDMTDGDISHTVQTSGKVDLSKFDTNAQVITYTCKNSVGASQSARRYVYVHEGSCPKCVLLGKATMTVEASFPYVDDGISCTDNFPHPHLQYSRMGGQVDVETAGTYKVTYIATDRAGNDNTMCGQAPTIRTVAVVDTLKPVIGLKYRSQPLLESSTTAEVSSTEGAQSNPAIGYFAGFMAEDDQPQVWYAVAIGSFGSGIALLARILRTARSDMKSATEPLQTLI